MPKQIQVKPAPAAEGSVKLAPSLQRSPSEQVPSLLGVPSRPVPALPSSPTEQAPMQLTVPSERSLFKPAPQEAPLPLAREGFLESTNWCCTSIGLLLICTILLTLVIILGTQVERVSKKSEEQIRLIQVQILVLTEILRQLQTGKVPNCSMCKIKWVQHTNTCYLFRSREMSWLSSMGFCRDEFSTLAIIKNPEEMDFLKLTSKTYFDMRHGQYRYDKFWIGLKYDAVTKQWKWADGTLFDNHLNTELTDKGCIYLQNGRLHSQPCHEAAYIICQTKVQFGWN